MNKTHVLKQIEKITSKLISVSLSVTQNFPSEINGFVYISGNHDLSIALKNIPYNEIYDILNKEKNYNVKLIDGALIQMMYTFDDKDNLLKSRLAFFPSPYLEEYQSNSEVYELDEIYADVIYKNISPVPIRFDYDPDNHTIIEHPMSHLTLGQYKNCRIPVTTPLSPNIFMDFLLRNFYNTAFRKYTKRLAFNNKGVFSTCIDQSEKHILHLSIE